MPRQAKTRMTNISIYIPHTKQKAKPIERLIRLAEKQDRSVNYLVVEAIMEYLKREKG